MRRLLVLLVVALGLAPGTWVRSPPSAPDRRQILTFEALPLARADLGPLELAGAWELTSPNSDFGSYSALVPLGEGMLLAASDRGSMMAFSVPGAPQRRVRIGHFVAHEPWRKAQRDIESLTRDPATGQVWAGFEMTHRIERYDAGFTSIDQVRPEAMQGWPSNSGAEAMVRLADGRFVVIAEGPADWSGADSPGLLFEADPVSGVEPVRFSFPSRAGFRPVDAAQLPDGRVLILLRKVEWGLPPGFAGKLVVADPAAIAEGQPWRATPVADLEAPLPTDNYEGLAVESDGRGGAVLWLISDDNRTPFQRTLLLRLEWPAYDEARGLPRAPR